MVELLQIQPPPGSTVAVDVHADGLTVDVPKQGLKKSSKGLIFMALFWNGFMAVVTAAVLANAIYGFGDSDIDWSDPWDVAFVAGIGALFWVVGVGMVVLTFYAASRRAVLDVVGDTLVVTRASIFGLRQQERRAADITSLGLGPTNVEVNHRPVNALTIHARDDKMIQLLGQLDDEEIEFIAELLRRALRVPAADADLDPE